MTEETANLETGANTEMDLNGAADALFQKWQASGEVEGDDAPKEDTPEELTEESEEEELPEAAQGDETLETADDGEEVSESEEAETEGTDETGEYTVEALAEALELSPDDFGEKFQASVTVDGETFQVPLSELRAGYQKEADYRRKTMSLAAERKAHETEQNQFRESSKQALTNLGALIQQGQAALFRDFEGVNWQELRESDPGEFAAKQAEAASRQQQLQQFAQQAMYQQQQLMQQEQAQAAAQKAEQAEQARQQLLERIPEWKDQKKFGQEAKELSGYLFENGYSMEELNELYDPRLIVLARKARAHDTAKTTAAQVRKKTKVKGPVLRPGATVNQRARRGNRLDGLRKRLKASGSVDDVAALLLERNRSR